jgi:hypothetical protein
MPNTLGSAVRRPNLAPEDYNVGWICAIPIKLTAIIAILNTPYSLLKS